MNTIELFCGTKSFSNIAGPMGYKTLTIDINPQFKPDIIKDILEIEATTLINEYHILWASPPCTAFSVASIGRHWGAGLGNIYPKQNKQL